MINPIDAVPIWAILIGTLFIVFAAIWLGNWCGRLANTQAASDAPINSVTGAHLGLLAFFLAFSFNMASSHYDERRKLILEEANAISTAYFASSLLADDENSRAVRALLREYVSLRANLSPESDIAAVIRESEEIQIRMRAAVKVLTEAQGIGTAAASVVASMSDVFRYHNRRVAAGLQYRIPASIWPALYAILIFSMCGLGYTFGLKGRRNHLASFALALSFSTVIYLTADLDRPASGLIMADQRGIAHLAELMAETTAQP